MFTLLVISKYALHIQILAIGPPCILHFLSFFSDSNMCSTFAPNGKTNLTNTLYIHKQCPYTTKQLSGITLTFEKAKKIFSKQCMNILQFSVYELKKMSIIMVCLLYTSPSPRD